MSNLAKTSQVQNSAERFPPGNSLTGPLPPLPPDALFEIESSSTLSCRLSDHNQQSSQTRFRDKKQCIAAELYRLSQHRKVLEASQQRILAEVQLCEKQQQEARILGFLEYQGVNLKNLEPEVAFTLGSIVREILVAKRQLARCRAEETREVLRGQVDSATEVCASLSDANVQMGPILKLLHDSGWPFDLPTSVFSFETHPLTNQRFPSVSFLSNSWVSPPPTQLPSLQTIRFPWENHIDRNLAFDSDEEE